MNATARDPSGASGTIRVATYETDEIVEAFDETDVDWEQLSEYERWLALRSPGELTIDDLNLDRGDRELTPERARRLLDAAPPTPDETETTNTTVDGLNEYIVDELDPGQTVDLDASHMAFGDDGASGTSSSDSSLNNEQYRTSVTDNVDNGKDLLCSTFLDSSEANGYTIDEVGVITASSGGTLLNHATISSVSKDSTKTATIDVTLEFRAA